ncbi:MAG: hypothetical protein QOK42_1462 [Frankiaceae bacterium]|nr:hypothetical protein [Frankiaceae bacterium]
MSATVLEPPAPAYPAPVTLPRVAASPVDARRLARAYRESARTTEDAARQLRQVVQGLPWAGRAAQSRWVPAEVVLGDLHRLAEGLHEVARSLESYAHALDKAHEKHHWSLKKLAVIGAVVVVTAVAVTVTMGAAAVAVGTAEAALAEGALAGAGAAVTAATAAEAGATASLLSSAGMMTGLRVLGTFVLPKLAQAEIAGGLSALQQEVFAGEISGSQVLLDMQLGLAASAATGAGLRAVRGAELTGAVGWAAPHLVVGAGVAGTSALGQWETTGSVSAQRVARDGALGAYFSGVGWTIARNSGLAYATPREIELSKRYNWNNPDTLARHVADHAADLGITSPEEYVRQAQALLRRAEVGEVEWGWQPRHRSVAVLDRTSGTFATFDPVTRATKTLYSLLAGGQSDSYVTYYWKRYVEPWPRGKWGV